MLLRQVEYARPASVEDAVRLLAEHDGARPLAGGQTLVNVMKQRAASPDVLVDLADLEELRAIGFGDDGQLELGAMVTLTRLIDSSEVEVARPILAEVGRTVADVQVRNRGTIGGNVCVNDPTNHFPPLLVALGATMTVRGAGGEREVPADEFFLGVYLTAVGEGELLTKISVPPGGHGVGDGFAGVGVGGHGKETVGAHGTYIVDAAATVGNGGVRVALGCVAGAPVRATAMEERLSGGDLSEEAVRAAAEGLGASLDPPSDVHASADYRRHLAEVSAARAVLQASQRSKG
jgi:aerobic carbon-monoxide dehydrogenase medium subunit